MDGEPYNKNMEEWRHLDDSWSAQININAEASYSRTLEVHAGKNKFKKSRKNSSRFSNEIESTAEERQAGVKKLDHNAKERIRRMKLNASYLALRALLPDSRRSKKKWSAPAIVDRVLKYIPELENEVEALRCSKVNVQSQAKENPGAKYEGPTISLSQVNQQEAIFQVCMARQEESQLTKLLQSLEDEGMCIKSASALDISETRICHHLHIQTNNIASEAGHHFEELRDKGILLFQEEQYIRKICDQWKRTTPRNDA